MRAIICRCPRSTAHGLRIADIRFHTPPFARTETVPEIAARRPFTVVLIDEVESFAVRRSAASLEANPVDVHRATDAVLLGIDEIAKTLPSVLVGAALALVNIPKDRLEGLFVDELARLQPTAGHMRMLKESVLRGWHDRKACSKERGREC